MENINTVSNEELLASLKNMRGGECQIVADIVRYLAEVDLRQVYREYGYPSLFVFCTKGLGYSEGAAYRRITAARCMKDSPEVYELLRDGKVSLCSLSEVAKVITPENKVEVLTLTRDFPVRRHRSLRLSFRRQRSQSGKCSGPRRLLSPLPVLVKAKALSPWPMPLTACVSGIVHRGSESTFTVKVTGPA